MKRLEIKESIILLDLAEIKFAIDWPGPEHRKYMNSEFWDDYEAILNQIVLVQQNIAKCSNFIRENWVIDSVKKQAFDRNMATLQKLRSELNSIKKKIDLWSWEN